MNGVKLELKLKNPSKNLNEITVHIFICWCCDENCCDCKKIKVFRP